jgi:hypothetical protein
MRRNRFVIGVMLLGLVLTTAARNDHSAPQQPTGDLRQPLIRVTKQAGWRVPGREEFRTVARVETVSFRDEPITRKTLLSSSQPLIDEEGYSTTNDGGLFISNVLCEVKEVYSYELNGHLFAYEAYLQFVKINSRGNRERTGAMFHLWYYDEDGGGRFDTRIGGSELQEMPAWAKQKPADANR